MSDEIAIGYSNWPTSFSGGQESSEKLSRGSVDQLLEGWLLGLGRRAASLSARATRDSESNSEALDT